MCIGQKKPGSMGQHLAFRAATWTKRSVLNISRFYSESYNKGMVFLTYIRISCGGIFALLCQFSLLRAAEKWYHLMNVKWTLMIHIPFIWVLVMNNSGLNKSHRCKFRSTSGVQRLKRCMVNFQYMMTSSNGRNIFCVTGPLCGEVTGRW